MKKKITIKQSMTEVSVMVNFPPGRKESWVSEPPGLKEPAILERVQILI